MTIRSSLVAAVAAMQLTGCWWTTPAHDAGDEAFAAHAIEAVLGRKPRGSAEVRGLADLVARAGREAAVDVLFEDPDYVAYWGGVLADDLQLQRSGAMQIDANCTAPALLDPDLSVPLAEHLATQPPTEPFCVWSTPKFTSTFVEDQFWAAVDAAASKYQGTPVDALEVPVPLEAPVWVDRGKEARKKSAVSELPDLEAQGAGRTNRGYQVDDGLKGNAQVDAARWDEFRGLAYKECPPFNLTDVVEASVRADRLDALYRAYLPVLATFPGSSDDEQMRDELGARFLDVYLDRDPTCMSCHTATYSRTDPRPKTANWDRFYPLWYFLPIPLDAEGTVFSIDFGGGAIVYGGDGGPDVRDGVGAFFRRDNHVSGGIRPWGMDEACVTNAARGFDGFVEWLPNDPTGDLALFGGRFGATHGVFSLIDAFSEGTSTFHTVNFVQPDWAAYRAVHGAPASPTNPGCAGCHEAPGAPTTANPGAPKLAVKAPTMTDQRLFSIVRFGSGDMPPMATTDAAAWNAVAWVRANYPNTPALQMENRTHAFVYLVAARIANNLADELLGEDLVMAHGFPRNEDQARALSSIAMTLSGQFSLKAVLRQIVLSDGFNRLAPADAGTTPYALQMLPYPEAGVSPVEPVVLGSNANSEGDFVHKHSPSGLLHQVHAALGWPAPPLVGDPTAYPSAELMRSIGRYTDTTRTEADQFGLDTYLHWETAVASCRKPDEVFAGDVVLAEGVTAGRFDRIGPADWVDWIDLLVEESTRTSASWEQIALAIEDRLLGEASLSTEERSALLSLWGLAGLGGSPVATGGAISDDEEGLLRDYCAVLLSSPQFLLRGPSPVDEPTNPPAAPVCLPGEPCDEVGWAALYEDRAVALGWL